MKLDHHNTTQKDALTESFDYETWGDRVTYNQTAAVIQATIIMATDKCQQKHMVTNMTLSCSVKSHSGPLSG